MTGKIIPLPGNPHRDVQTLLPWYVTGQLDPPDTARVEGHVDGCGECRADLERERRLDHELNRRPADVDSGWAMLRDRLERDRAQNRLERDRAQRRPAAARPVPRGAVFGAAGAARRTTWKWIGWGVGAQLATTAVLATVVLPERPRAEYHALAAAEAPAAGNLVVIFRPETSEQVLRTTLRANAARLVDGPTAANAYVLSVPADRRDALAAALRRQPQIVLAEPIGAGPQR